MGLVDDDLLSVQESRVLLEQANHAREPLEWMEPGIEDAVLGDFQDVLVAQAPSLARQAVAESDYGNADDEAELMVWVARHLIAQALKQEPVHSLRREADGSMVALLPRGVCVSLLPDLLTLPVLASQMAWAVKSRCPLIVSCPGRACRTAKALFLEFASVLERLGFPAGTVAWLDRPTPEGDRQLTFSDEVDLVIDSRGAMEGSRAPAVTALRGNNPVFVERTADVALAARQIVASASFDCGALPGAESSLVVESAIDEPFRKALKAEGCRFLDAEETRSVASVLFDASGAPRRESLAKPAMEIARRAGVACDPGCRLLVAERPYVSSTGAHTQASAAPFVTYYVEEDWREACQKCIELILAYGHGVCLSVFTGDKDVAREFVLRKPVSRVLINSACGLGSCGRAAHVPATLTLGGWREGTSAVPALTRDDFLSLRQVGFGEDTVPSAAAFLGSASRSPASKESDPFDSLLCDLRPLRGEEER